MKTYIKNEKHIIKGKEFDVECEYYYDEDICEYFEDEDLCEKNLKRIRNEYRRIMNLLTDDEIKSIREKYGLSQKDFALLLGMGEVTITRYESKLIQDAAQNSLIKMASDPNAFYDYVCNNKEKYIKEYDINKYNLVKERIHSLCQTNLEYLYSIKNANEEFTGGTSFSEKKCIEVVREIVNELGVVKKTQLAKLLWYIDFVCYKENHKSMTGGLYYHYDFGAMPYYFDELLKNENIVMSYKFYEDYEMCLIGMKESRSSDLSKEDKNIIKKICSKLGGYSVSNLVELMHEEDAYFQTKPNELISYKYAKKIRL